MKDVVEQVAKFAKDNDIKIPELHITENQWYELVEELDDFPPIVTGYLYMNDVKVICPRIFEQWRQPRRLSVTWDGSNIEEVVETVRKAYKLRNVTFDADQSIELSMYRRDWDAGGAKQVMHKLAIGDELVVEIP